MRVETRVAIWAGGSAVGVGILMLPDSGPRVVSFSDAHGPSAVDLVGIAVLVGAWCPIVALLWHRRRALATRRGRHCGTLAAAGVVGLTLAVGLDLGDWWVVAVITLVIAQAWALVIVARSGDPGDGAGSVGLSRR
jgi:hypothetical protein